jgi:hypothetical protein
LTFSLTFYALTLWAPKNPANQAIDLTSKKSDNNKSWRLRVFDFRNFGDQVEKRRIGERFSEYLLDSLLNIDTKIIGTKDIQGVKGSRIMRTIPTRLPPATIHLRDGLSELVPFFAVLGTVEDNTQDSFTARIKLIKYYSIEGGYYIFRIGYKIPYVHDKMINVANNIAQEIVNKIENENNDIDKKAIE